VESNAPYSAACADGAAAASKTKNDAEAIIDFNNKPPVFFLDLDEGKPKQDLVRKLMKCGSKVSCWQL
jgi:hypothetical protein